RQAPYPRGLRLPCCNRSRGRRELGVCPGIRCRDSTKRLWQRSRQLFDLGSKSDATTRTGGHKLDQRIEHVFTGLQQAYFALQFGDLGIQELAFRTDSMIQLVAGALQFVLCVLEVLVGLLGGLSQPLILGGIWRLFLVQTSCLLFLSVGLPARI